jgi:uncharacterized membrane protein YoaT (DUF817 family)
MNICTRHACSEFAAFTVKQAKACAFAGPFIALLAVAKYVPIPALAHYDTLFVGAILIQAVLVARRLESVREVLVLSAFHALGMGLELYKTSPGVASWSYPEPCFFRVATVPLYSGFMYASVASYIMQAWRIFDLHVERYPPLAACGTLCAAIYANFFTERAFGDCRWWLFALLIATFGRTTVRFTVIEHEHSRRMPLLLAFALIGLFIWVAENIATYFGAWQYPHQHHGWAMVHGDKISSWTLLVIISFLIVSSLKQAFDQPMQDIESRTAPTH